MIIFKQESKTLTIPRGIGNIENIEEAWGGGVSREEVQEMIDDAIIEAGAITPEQVDTKIENYSRENLVYNIRGVNGIWKGTQEEYDNLPDKDMSVLYIIL